MDDDFDVAVLSREAKLLLDHGTAQTHFGCSLFWVLARRPDGDREPKRSGTELETKHASGGSGGLPVDAHSPAAE
jgi:hypothetical protein